MFVNSEVEKRFFELNTSPSGRGSLLIAERTGDGQARLSFRPSKATPVLLKVFTGPYSEEPLSAFYTLTSSEVPIDVGGNLVYWDGAGACLAPSGTLITQEFSDRPDRAAVSNDPVQYWETAYGVDFGQVHYSGDAYLRTIFYTKPLEDSSLLASYPLGKISFMTPDQGGAKLNLGGVSGMPYNNPAGGSGGDITAVSDIFGLVKEGKVCVVDSGRKASFFWNPKAIYEAGGTERNISELTNSLKAGQTCIGYG